MAARGWARLILDRRRDLINNRPNRATAAKAPLDEAQERYHFDNPTTHTRGACQTAKQHSALALPCIFCLRLSTVPRGLTKTERAICSRTFVLAACSSGRRTGWAVRRFDSLELSEVPGVV